MSNSNIRAQEDTYYHNLVLDQLQVARKAGSITAAEERIILNYLTQKDAEQTSPQRYYKLSHYILRLKTDCHLSNFQTCSTAEIIQAFNRIRALTKQPNGLQQLKRSAGQQTTALSRNTINDQQRAAKSFFIWLADTKQNKNIDARAIEKMRPIRQDLNTVTINSILTPEEIERIFLYCKSPRDNAMVRVLYSAALRVGELCNLKFKDVYNIADAAAAISNNEPITNTVFIETDGKTGKIRRIPLVDLPTLTALCKWYAIYPGTITPDSYLFVNNRGDQLTQGTVSIQLKRIAEKAGINKNVHPHIFRHSRATHMLNAGLNESHVKMILWGSLKTDMIHVYGHLSPDDIADALTQANSRDKPTCT